MHRTQGADFDTDVYGDGTNKRGHKPQNAGVTEGTYITADILNAYQEELCIVIEEANITLEPDGASDKSNGWGQLLEALQGGQILRNASFPDNEINGVKLVLGSVNADAILADSTVTKDKLANNTKNYFVSDTYAPLAYSGGGGGASKITQFTRSVGVGEWYRIRLTVVNTIGDDISWILYDGDAAPGSGAPGVPEIKGGRLTYIGSDTVTTTQEVVYKATSNTFSVLSGSTGSAIYACLSLELLENIRSDSPG